MAVSLAPRRHDGPVIRLTLTVRNDGGAAVNAVEWEHGREFAVLVGWAPVIIRTTPDRAEIVVGDHTFCATVLVSRGRYGDMYADCPFSPGRDDEALAYLRGLGFEPQEISMGAALQLKKTCNSPPRQPMPQPVPVPDWEWPEPDPTILELL